MAVGVAADTSRSAGHVSKIHSAEIADNVQRTHECAAVGVTAMPCQAKAPDHRCGDAAAVATVGIGNRTIHAEVGQANADAAAAAAGGRCTINGSAPIAPVTALARKT